jgi:hypothetical protein
MGFKYAEKKLSCAARTLESGVGTIQQRLHDVFTFHLARLDSRDLPEELRTAFAELQEVAASTRPISAECADRCAALIVNLKNYVSTVARAAGRAA